MYCNNCGKEIDNEWKVCPYCGARNENVLTESTPQPTPQMNYGQPVPQMNYNQPMPQPSYNQQYGQPLDFNRDFINPAQPKPKKKSKLPIIITAVVLVVAIVLGAIFVPGLIKGKDVIDETISDSIGDNYVVSENTVWVMNSCTDNSGKEYKITYAENYDILSVRYSNEGTDSGYEYKCNAYGVITEKTSYYYYKDGAEKRAYYAYNKDGKIIEMTLHTLGVTYTYEYDSKGLLSEEKIYNYEDKCDEGGCYYEYNETGNCIKKTEYDSDGSEGTVYEYSYDEKGRLIEERKLIGGNYLYYVEKYRYNDNDDIIEVITEERYSEQPIRNAYSFEYQYDTYGNIIKVTRYNSGNFVYSFEMKYTAIDVSAERGEKIKDQQKELLKTINPII